MNFEILTPRFREMVTLNYFGNSVEVWSHTPFGMSCDLIKILVINLKGYGIFLSTFFKHRWCSFGVVHKFVPKSKAYSVWSTVARPEVLSYNNTSSSLHSTWTEYNHSNELELMRLLLLNATCWLPWSFWTMAAAVTWGYIRWK